MRIKARGVLAIALIPAGAACQDLGRPAEEPAYCRELQQIVSLATTKERFSSITGASREGSFASTRLSLSGWSDCALYGSRTYTCDSMRIRSEPEAERALQTIVGEIRACLGTAWSEVRDRSSASYVDLHGLDAVSITLNTDRLDEDFVVRLTMFLRAQ